MATSLGLVQHVVNTLAAARPLDGDPPTETLSRLLAVLDDAAAQEIPATIGEVLPLLRDDELHLQLAIDLIQRVDLYEAWPGFATLLRAPAPSGEVLAAASRLSNHPGVPLLLRELLELTQPLAQLPEWQGRLIDLRLRPDAPATTLIERTAAGEQWPGSDRWTPGNAPVIALHPSAGSPEQVLGLARDLSELGCIVRRLPLEPVSTVPRLWLATWSPVVAADTAAATRSLAGLDHGVIVATGGQLGPSSAARVLAEIENVLPPSSGYVRQGVEPLDMARDSAPDASMTTELLSSGSHSRLEVAFLSGARARDLTEFAKSPGLEPRSVHGTYYWSFSQLVAVRTWRYFKSISPGPVGRKVAERLVAIAQAEEATLVGVTQAGRVFARDDDGDLVDVENGQTASEAVLSFADRLFKPFPLGSGRSAPDLLRPSRHTRVNPMVAGGSPVVANSRIPALAVHQMLNPMRQSSGTTGLDTVLKEYPELSAESVHDADRLARTLLASR